MSKYAFKINDHSYKSRTEFQNICKSAISTEIIPDFLADDLKTLCEKHPKVGYKPSVIKIERDHQFNTKCFYADSIPFSYKTALDAFNNKFYANNITKLRNAISNDMAIYKTDKCEKCGLITDTDIHHVKEF